MACGTGGEPTPIIIGVGRSGTTLLRLMLDSHSDLAIPPETGFIPAVAALTTRAARLREDVFRTVTASPTWPDFGIAPEPYRAALQEIEPFDAAEGVRAFYRLYAARFAKRRWGDKTPLYCLHLTEIEALLPEARFIHIIRDGRDVALSVRGLWFAPGRDIDRIARDWCWRIQRARELGRNCRHYVEVRYEDLVRNPAGQLEPLCAFVGLDYQRAMERYFQRARERLDEVKTRFNADGTVLITKDERLFNQRLTMQPPDETRVFRWKRDMTRQERTRFETVAGAMLEELGYET